MNNNTIEVHFLHPFISGQSLTADISPQCTGQEAIRELMADDGTGAFLSPLKDGQSYGLNLIRTKQAITPNTTFAQAGVMNGDTIQVDPSASGACIQKSKALMSASGIAS